MSAAPRPYSLPSRWVGAKGGEVHCSSGPVGTTSVWPANASSLPSRAVEPRFTAHRFVTPPDSIVSQSKPIADSRSIRSALAVLVVGRDGGARDQFFGEEEGAGHGFEPLSIKNAGAAAGS